MGMFHFQKQKKGFITDIVVASTITTATTIITPNNNDNNNDNENNLNNNKNKNKIITTPSVNSTYTWFAEI